MPGLPDLLTVEEAARVLRIGRTKAYAMAGEWRRTGGRSGLPVVDLGDALRVPLCQLEAMIGGPITSIGPPATTTAAGPATDAPVLAQAVGADPAPQPSSSPARSVRRPSRRRTRMADQPTLPFLGGVQSPV